MKTLPVGIAAFAPVIGPGALRGRQDGRRDAPVPSVGGAVLPALQRYFFAGLSSGGFKG